MGTWGTAGASAREGYRSASAGRRRAARIRWVLLVFGAAGIGMAALDLRGRERIVVCGFLGILFLAVAVRRPDPDPERWLRGSDGEVRTAEALAALPSTRWQVFHDLAVPGRRANIDHLVVGRSGVWVIDTKTTRSTVRVGLRSVRLGDRPLNTDTVRWLADLVSERLGVAARPLIVLDATAPGIGRRGVRRAGVRMVLSRDLARRLKKGRRRLTRRQVGRVGEEVLSVFRYAGPDRQNEAARQKRSHASQRT